MAGVEAEIRLIEQLSSADVVALSTLGDPTAERERYDLPAANVNDENGPTALLSAVRDGWNASAADERDDTTR